MTKITSLLLLIIIVKYHIKGINLYVNNWCLAVSDNKIIKVHSYYVKIALKAPVILPIT